MFGTHSLGLFAATVFVVNATPGVDFAFTVTRTLQGGIRAGVAAALGIVGGCVLHALAAAFGLAALLAASATAFSVLKWAGAAYLLWLAIGMLRTAARPQHEEAAQSVAAAPAGHWRTFRDGLLTNALNPKIALFFLALLPQFIEAAAPNKTLAFLFLGAWFVVQGLAFLIALVVLIAPLRRWRPHDTWRRVLQGGAGGLFALLAARLALSERP
jgi:threonine/homoserine/homoserine lactone efflux protein